MNTAIIVAIITSSVLLLGYLLDRRGKREQAAQQVEAARLLERNADWERRGDIIKDLEADIERRRLKELTIHQECAIEVDRMRTEKRSSQASCSMMVRSTLETVALLQSVLQDEVTREIAGSTTNTATLHLAGHDEEEHE